jgi:cbb3-type cytochrome oxidase subunit 3
MGTIQFLRDHSVLLMLAAFAGVVAFAYLPGRKSRFERDAAIPLNDDR